MTTGTSQLKTQKRGDLIAEEIKRWITSGELRPGEKLPKEAQLQELFAVSKVTTREALKVLEVQGLITISAGANGGATVAEVPLARAFQLMQNYLFFKDISANDIYAVRRIIEPELAAGAVLHFTESDLVDLERSIEICEPMVGTEEQALKQRQEDLRFHDIIARANPNPFLRFLAQMLNEMLRQLVVLDGNASHDIYQKFGQDNVHSHRAILEAARRMDVEEVYKLTETHIVEAAAHVQKLQGLVVGKLVLDSEMNVRVRLKPAGEA
jgi:GntR family transcriptional repressor for pyruvate dehydrogenase complex